MSQFQLPDPVPNEPLPKALPLRESRAVERIVEEIWTKNMGRLVTKDLLVNLARQIVVALKEPTSPPYGQCLRDAALVEQQAMAAEAQPYSNGDTAHTVWGTIPIGPTTEETTTVNFEQVAPAQVIALYDYDLEHRKALDLAADDGCRVPDSDDAKN